MKETRRDFLKKSGGCALGMVSLATQMQHLGTLSAMAQKVIDSPGEGGGSYKALVLLYWAGGNDGNNMVIPNHNDATISNYTAYFNARNTQGLALTQASLLPITVPRLGNLTYGLHPNLGDQTANGGNRGIYELWGMPDSPLAIVTNVGNLVHPLSKAQYVNGSIQKPYQLFSHSDQVTQSQTSNAKTQTYTGWGGRIADRMTDGSNPTGLVPMITSIAGSQLFTAGQTKLPMAIAQANADAIPPALPTNNLTSVLTPAGFGTPPAGANLARLTAFNTIRSQDLAASSNFIKSADGVTEAAMQANSALQSSQDVASPFPNTSISLQLKQVARLIKSRNTLNINRQVFYVQIGGFDTHTNQIPNQGTLFTQFSQGIRAFWDEMRVQGMQNDVTLFTLSDFGRTLNLAGSGGAVGSDHAWGNHMFVLGGGVVGGNFYGSLRPDGSGNYYPTLVMGPSGADDTDNSGTPANNRGRWIRRHRSTSTRSNSPAGSGCSPPTRELCFRIWSISPAHFRNWDSFHKVG